MHWSNASLHRFDLDAVCVCAPRCLARPVVAAFEGSATGSAYAFQGSADAALSEYVERRHFCHRVPTAGKMALRCLEPGAEVLGDFYRQTRRSFSVEWPESLAFCWALRWCDWAVVRIPRNLVGMGHGESEEEFELHPYRDSSGMACHRSDVQAITMAVLEFVERQTWLARWLGGATARLLDPSLVSTLAAPEQPDWRWAAHWLDAGLGGYTFFVVGENQGQRVCATATRLDAECALRKALMEADHCRAFLADKQEAVSQGRAASRYERSAMAYSSQGYPDRIFTGASEASVLASTEWAALPVCELEQVRERILAISPHVYLYLAQEISVFGRHSLARLLSPDFYAHADPGACLNFHNAFATHLGISCPPLAWRTSTCLP